MDDSEGRIIIKNHVNDAELFKRVEQRLIPGTTIKNYKELCNTLDLPKFGGNQKKLQIENLSRFCLFEKTGQKILVKEIYDMPKMKEDKRKNTSGNHAIFVTLIESILLDYFITRKKKRGDFTKSQLWEILGLVNSSYAENYDNRNFLKQMQTIDNSIRQWHINQIYSTSRRKLNDIVKSALKSLSLRKLIEYNDRVLVAYKKTRNGKKGKYIEIKDEDQISEVLACERESINELIGNTIIDKRTGKVRQTNLNDIIYGKNVTFKDYLEIRNRRLKETLGFEYVFRRYSIICNSKYLEQGLKENQDVLRQTLNGKFIKSMNDMVKKDFRRNRENLKAGKTEFIYPNNYIEIGKLLVIQICGLDEETINDFMQDITIHTAIDELF